MSPKAVYTKKALHNDPGVERFRLLEEEAGVESGGDCNDPSVELVPEEKSDTAVEEPSVLRKKVWVLEYSDPAKKAFVIAEKEIVQGGNPAIKVLKEVEL